MDGCLARGLAPVVTFNHFTDPHWFAKQGGLARRRGAAERFDRDCDRVMSGSATGSPAVTLNEPNLPRLLSWMPAATWWTRLQRATLRCGI